MVHKKCFRKVEQRADKSEQSVAAGNQSQARTTQRSESVNEICNATASIKQTIKDTFNKQSDKMSADDSQIQQLAIEPRVKRPFTIALIDLKNQTFRLNRQ